MMIHTKKIILETKKQFEIINISEQAMSAVLESKVKNGLAVVFCPHTTAGVRLNHDEPLLMQDIMKMLYRLVPIDTNYSHDLFEVRQNVAPNERSNGHAHVKAFLLGSSESLLVENSKLLLGQKQSLFFVEMDGGRLREVYIKIVGE
ncbi:MAG: secondary thiamine-phosphate synthase enzyme YjbQ [Legionella sp.]|uniref:secondary thiamine-phosphate synthase enzyme YjbQ n=1 Tax=Legionella sp. TaxID=459 RepID=UPI002842197F|nr:secondary thiamine-phosphate synthase enzyme YjbQ [Legionella sp.]